MDVIAYRDRQELGALPVNVVRRRAYALHEGFHRAKVK